MATDLLSIRWKGVLGMKEYIEREPLLQDISETVIFTVHEGTPLPNAEMRGANKVIDRIKSAKAADVVEVRHGEWYLLDECANEGVYCSVCRKKVYRTEYANQKVKSNYCPNCGAKMDGKGEGE
jgi:hypothetical protein